MKKTAEKTLCLWQMISLSDNKKILTTKEKEIISQISKIQVTMEYYIKRWNINLGRKGRVGTYYGCKPKEKK